jgi:putative heme-binding domain-containing protein
VLWLFWLILLVMPEIAGSASIDSNADRYKVSSLADDQAAEYKLDTSFYKKSLMVQNILIATSARVSDVAILEAAYQFDMMMQSIAPAVAERIRDRKVLCLLIAHDEFTSDLPQFKSEKTGKELDFYNWRNRGFLTHLADRPTVVFAEEDVLEFEGGMQLESILIHEFGHVIQGAGFDDKLQEQLAQSFERARAQGIWNDGRAAQRFRRVKSIQPVSLFDALVQAFPEQSPELIKKCLDGGDILVNEKPANSRVKVSRDDKVLIVFAGPKECYAHRNKAEYWAEGVQCWYDTNRTMDHDHNHIHTREQLKEYDPPLAKLCEEVLGDSEWRFVSPRQRAGQEHLADFDPATSPECVDPPHIENAAYDYYDKYWATFWQRLQEKHSLARQLSAESLEELAQDVREQGNAVRGAILFAQQKTNCVKCHASGGRNLLGPDLTNLDEDTTDVYLVESILQPSKVIKQGYETFSVTMLDGKTFTGRIVEQDSMELVLRETSGTSQLITLMKQDISEMFPNQTSAMPDGLVDQLPDRQSFLDLAKYMLELADAGSDSGVPLEFATEGGGESVSDELRGMILLSDLNCAACHSLAAQLQFIPPKHAPNLAWSSGKINPAYIERFIATPTQVKPGTSMPDMMRGLDANARSAAAKAITQYLISLGSQEFSLQDPDPVAAERGSELFHSVGCVACHLPRSADGGEKPLQESVALGDLSAKYNVDGLVELLKNPHAVRPSGRMPNMQLSHWEARDIAHFLLQKTINTDNLFQPYEIDSSLVDEGKKQFQKLGCTNCHTHSVNAEELNVNIGRADEGCLSDKKGNWPAYQLNDSQRALIRAALRRETKALTDKERVDLTLSAFNCLSCHQRGELGGVSPERDEYFQTTNQNLGQQGRIPPTLTGVGAKLKPKWLREVLVSGRAIRPYMQTRMPQFGADNVGHLVSLFERTDQVAEVKFAQYPDQEQIKKAGHALVGSGGLNCIACHTFQQKPAETMPAVDLTEMAVRLRQEWFYQYMRDPQRISPNTVMPSFWPGGHAMRKDILQGDTDLQIEALWQYLLDERQARTPQGLINEPMELIATDEAVMLRRSYNEIGKRGIGVGYPGQVNLAFDAEQMRLAMIWKGKFADPSGVWRSQGHGTVRPLGNDLIRFAKGPEFDDATKPWIPPDLGDIAKLDQPNAADVNIRPPLHQFRGYYLDKLQRPTFMYRFDNVEVEDYPIDVTGDDQSVLLRRTLTFTTETGRKNVAFRVATDENMVPEQQNTFLIGKMLRIRLDEEHIGEIVETATGKQLRIVMDLAPGNSTLVLEYRW